MNKYHNKKTIIDGITFDSKKEARRYQDLKLLERSNTISGLKLKTKWLLIPPQVINGKTERCITYSCDFEYERDGKHIVEDCKGMKTDVYKIKKRLMKQIHNIEIYET